MPYLRQVRSVLAVRDLAKSVAFYREKLGFTLDFEVEGWSFLSRDEFRLMLGHCPDEVPAGETGNHSWFAYATVEEIDDLYRELGERGVVPTQALEDKTWGMREFAVTTPDGHRIVFGQQLK